MEISRKNPDELCFLIVMLIAAHYQGRIASIYLIHWDVPDLVPRTRQTRV
jgi:hypothetical protein